MYISARNKFKSCHMSCCWYKVEVSMVLRNNNDLVTQKSVETEKINQQQDSQQMQGE